MSLYFQLKDPSIVFHSINNYKTFFSSSITFITKLPSKLGLATSITIIYNLDQSSSTHENLVNIDTANSRNQLDFGLNNSDIKTNIIFTIFNINIP